MSAKPKPPKPDRGDAAQAAYETTPKASDPARYFTPVDLNALTFSETARTPYDGDESRSQGKFRTTDSTKTS